MPDIMTLAQAAKYLQITESAMYKMARGHKIPASRVGNRWRFQKEVLDQWLRQQSQVVTPSERAVLVVDDDTTLCQTVADLLSQEGYVVFAANTGERAKELARTVRLGIAFVDLKLPDVSGVEVLKALIKEQPGTQLVVITGYPDSELMNQALELGCFAVLKKPFRVARLLEMAALLSGTELVSEALR